MQQAGVSLRDSPIGISSGIIRINIILVVLYTCTIIYDYIWLYMIIYDYIWLYMIIYDYIWLYMIIYSYIGIIILLVLCFFFLIIIHIILILLPKDKNINVDWGLILVIHELGIPLPSMNGTAHVDVCQAMVGTWFLLQNSNVGLLEPYFWHPMTIWSWYISATRRDPTFCIGGEFSRLCKTHGPYTFC